MHQNKYKEKFYKLLNTYPSPHNGQPIRLKENSNDILELYFDCSRGLKSTDISYLFSFVSIGVFYEYIVLCSKALGHHIQSTTTTLPKEKELQGNGLVKFAEVHISWNTHVPDTTILDALRFRQTSRKKYYQGTSEPIDMAVITAAQEKDMTLRKLPKNLAREAIWLNQRAVFDDIKNAAVRDELDHWLRYTADQKVATKDGLAYDCMELNGKAMKYIIDHPNILNNRFLSYILKKYYLRTMSDNSDVFYMLAPFKTESDSFEVGTMVMRIWHLMSLHKLYIHPFGTIMSNTEAHRDFLKLVNVTNENQENSYLVFIFRAGKSEVPVSSLRIPYQSHLIFGGNDV